MKAPLTDGNYRGFVQQSPDHWKRLDRDYAIDVVMTDGEWTAHHLAGARIVDRSFYTYQEAINAVLDLQAA